MVWNSGNGLSIGLGERPVKPRNQKSDLKRCWTGRRVDFSLLQVRNAEKVPVDHPHKVQALEEELQHVQQSGSP